MGKAAQRSPKRNGSPSGCKEVAGIAALSLRGFKSIVDDTTISVRPLTVFAGANCSGKSSAIQPLLLLKQTIQAGLDPGPLLIGGPNVDLGSGEQMLSKYGPNGGAGICEIGVELTNGSFVRNQYLRASAVSLELRGTAFGNRSRQYWLSAKSKASEIRDCLPGSARDADNDRVRKARNGLSVERVRWHLAPAVNGGNGPQVHVPQVLRELGNAIGQVIHVPAWRWTGERSWRVVAADQDAFPGSFEAYLPSVLLRWRSEGDERFGAVQQAMRLLGLTSWVDVFIRGDTNLSLNVARRLESSVSETKDTVNLADTGTGVGPALVVVGALLAAKAGQAVYIDQPELHLHPRAQAAMAGTLVDAASRGVRVIVETHSELLLLGLQTLVARGAIGPDQVALHWFRRDPVSGSTEVELADLDQRGAFGEWPADFGEVALGVEGEYLRAARKVAAPRPS